MDAVSWLGTRLDSRGAKRGANRCAEGVRAARRSTSFRYVFLSLSALLDDSCQCRLLDTPGGVS